MNRRSMVIVLLLCVMQVILQIPVRAHEVHARQPRRCYELGRDYGYNGKEFWVADSVVKAECGDYGNDPQRIPRFLCNIGHMNNPEEHKHQCVPGVDCKPMKAGGWIFHGMERRGDRWVAECGAPTDLGLRCNVFVPGGHYWPDARHLADPTDPNDKGCPGIEDNGLGGAHLVFVFRKSDPSGS